MAVGCLLLAAFSLQPSAFNLQLAGCSVQHCVALDKQCGHIVFLDAAEKQCGNIVFLDAAEKQCGHIVFLDAAEKQCGNIVILNAAEKTLWPHCYSGCCRKNNVATLLISDRNCSSARARRAGQRRAPGRDAPSLSKHKDSMM